jgi:aromatic ring-opening dioxygenase catalytic subunit (LigB family)
LRDEGVLIVGIGMSFHNLRARGPQVTPVADEWDAALIDAVTDPIRGGRSGWRLGRTAARPFRASRESISCR